MLEKRADLKDVEILLDALRNAKSQEPRDRLLRLLGLVESKNPGTLTEMMRENEDMESIFMQILKPKIDEEISVAVNSTTRTNLYIYVQDGDMALDRAAQRAGLSTDEFRAEMIDHGYKVPQMA